ncbi:uncharacterized protein LOC108650108 isoform X2 [Drosophila navojoa]|uniref:uncharacterized protein LOC108650108 isoform X2 n=1 Tax=Drosophila navojoa TaxID=7232 RepID=UPI0011BF4967|nr:uncharacterized protein LOC108650108 isoform X2 [Drosophila navojoa]
MATEAFLDMVNDRAKLTKRPIRPKILKLTDVTTPHRSRKKIKIKSKDRSAAVRDRIYDDPAYTEDISHLANPLRRSSISGKSSGDYKLCAEAAAQQVASSSSLGKRSQLTKDFLKYAMNAPLKAGNSSSGNVGLEYEFDSSSSDNEQAASRPFKEGSLPRRVLSLERSLADKNDKKAAGQKRVSKQKRNLSLDNSRKGAQLHLQQLTAKANETRARKEQQHSRKQYLEAEVKLGRGSSDQDEIYSVRSSAQNSEATVKVPIGRRLLRGEIGIKSFNYYLLKEGLKSSKKLDKQRSAPDAPSGSSSSKSKLHTRSEENIYEEIFFKETPKHKGSAGKAAPVVQSDDEMQSQSHSQSHSQSKSLSQSQHLHQHQQQSLPDAGVYADCELCMQQCSNENCKYCLIETEPSQQETANEKQAAAAAASAARALPAAHILEFQSYNPNNPGVYKIETTPVAITGEYNPILQFQKSSTTAAAATTATITEQQQQQQQQHHKQQQQQQQHHHHHQQQQQQPPAYGFNQYQPHQKSYQPNLSSHPLTNHYAVGGGLLLAQVTPRRAHLPPQGYIVGYQNGGGGGVSVGVANSVHRINTKSSSSSDSLPYHKYNTMARLEANVFAAPATGDIYYAIEGVAGQPLHPLMYAASRPIGGSQILADQFESQMYKSDSKASILSEFSLRSSDNSQRYTRYPHRSGLFSSSNSGAHQRRLFGSTENCRVAYDCRRCSFDGVMSAGLESASRAPAERCSNSDNSRYECRNCDCSSSYFSSDFDDIYGSMARGGSSGIPRKTAAGTLPSSGPTEPSGYKQTAAVPEQPQQLDLKQNKYAMDFFKHVNDVKRSIYQSEMQRNNSLESTRRGHRNSSSNNNNNNSSNNNSRLSPTHTAHSEPLEAGPIITTLPLSKGRGSSAAKPTPAPRTSLQNQAKKQPAEKAPHTPSTRKPQPTERREYPSLDRLVASSTGAVPKWQGLGISEEEPKSSKQRAKHKETEPRERRDRSAPAAASEGTMGTAGTSGSSGKKHHRTNSGKAHSSGSNPPPSSRRKDIPAPPPPSPATYSDLQELKANMEGLRDDTKSRSLESEASETPTLVDHASAKSSLGTVKETETAVATESPTAAEAEVKASGGVDAAKAAAEVDDDDVFYDARSENSSLLPQPQMTEGVAEPENSQDLQNKDMSSMQPEVDKSEMLTPAIGLTPKVDKNKQQQQQQDEDENEQKAQKPKANEENALASTTMDTSTASSVSSQEPPTHDDYVAKASAEAGSRADVAATCCQSEPAAEAASGQHGEATVKTNIEAASKTKHNNNASSTELTTRNVDATNAEGQATTNVANASDSTIIGATSELSCKSAQTDSATLANRDPTVPTESVFTCQDLTCLDSSEAFSDDSHLTRDSVTRESQNDELSSSTHDKLDLSTLPLPALPPKRRRTRLRTSPSKHHQQQQQQQLQHQQQQRSENQEYGDAAEKSPHRNKKSQRDSVQDSINAELPKVPHDSASVKEKQLQQNLSAFQQYVAKRRESLEASTRNFNEKLEARRMLCHMGGSGGAGGAGTASTDAGVPTYLFGETFYGIPDAMRKSHSRAGHKEEIFLNKSGWVQVSKKLNSNSDTKSRRVNYSHYNGDSGIMDKGHGPARSSIRVVQTDHSHRPELSRSFGHQSSSRCEREPKFVGSKVEELIQRNEARLGGLSSRDPALRPGYRIMDPQLASLLNERPGFLPVNNDLESPPPVTPILSPPPAFQDNSSNSSRALRHQERRKVNLQQQPRVLQPPQQMPQQLRQGPAPVNATGNGKGMVFSRSFEYDTRRSTPTNTYVETFSRSFDDNLSERPLVMPSLAVQRERSLNFSTLTGNSPNYLTKREGTTSSRTLRSRDSSPKYLQPQTTAYLNASVKEAPPAYSVASTNMAMAKYSPRSRHDRTFERSKSHNVIGRSRKSQFNVGSNGPGVQPPVALGMSRFRSLDMTINNRLNSCDSGARSDLSNDELDNEDGSSTEFLSATNYQFPNLSTSNVSISPFKNQRQRSLTPDRNDSHSSSSSLRKQRSLTPESRSLTPEERRRKGSQISLSASRQNSSSRSNTLERRQRHDEKTPPTISRSSSSSSYSGGESHELLNGSPSGAAAAAGNAPSAVNYRRSAGRTSTAKQAEQEHLIRRSRSLQLSERSPNRGQKNSIKGAIPMQKQQQQQQQQAVVHYQQANSGMFPNSLRATVSANKLLPSSKSSAGGSSTRQRQNVDVDKARSFDFDYNNYNRSGNSGSAARSAHNSVLVGDGVGNQNLRLDCDKSRSFDEDYREALHNNNGGSGSGIHFLQPGTESTSSVRLRQSTSPVGAAGHERGTTRSPQSSGSSSNNLHLSAQRTNSPQGNSYGTRLCDHELTYEMLRKSPIMNFRRGDSDYEIPVQLRNRETINSGGNSELNFMSNDTHIYEHPTTVLKPQRSSSRDENLYRPTTGALPRSSSPATPDTRTAANKKCRKSLTSSDYWPRCEACSASGASSLPNFAPVKLEPAAGTQNSTTVVSKDAPQPHISKVALNGNFLKFDISKATTISPRVNATPAAPQWTFLCSGGVSPESTQSKSQRQPTAVIRPRVIPLTASSLVVLGNSDSSMKIPEQRSGESPTETYTSMKSNLQTANQNQKSANQHCQATTIRSKISVKPIIPEDYKRQRSHSLPSRIAASEKLQNIATDLRLPRHGKENVSIIGIRCNGFNECLSQQMRAISSPTLTSSAEAQSKQPTEVSQVTVDTASEVNNDGGNSFGVLQKFKRTFNYLNNKNQLQITPMSTTTTTTTPAVSAMDSKLPLETGTATASAAKAPTGNAAAVDASSAKYRFGPLIWRSSKERRKTKFNRRDKCNSGDSGIQIELEQDEHYMRTLASGQRQGAAAVPTNMPNTIEPKSRSIRRCHSAKATSILEKDAVKTPALDQLNLDSNCNKEREAPESLPTRSLSQPNGLDTYGKCRTDNEDSDSDSIASHEDSNNYSPVYAEVLYNFTAAGPQELGLERGTLIEILRKEVGPWWFGRIKKEDASLVEEILDPELGWFPKDFVRIIHSCEADAYFNADKTMLGEAAVAATAEDFQVPVPVCELSPANEDPNATMIADQNNITTIVIETPPTSIQRMPSIHINVLPDSYDAIRNGAIRELLETEVNYVKLLASICDGYLPAMSKRIDIFSPNSIRLIFSNITAIYKFQRKFLEALRLGIEQNQISKVFLKMHKGFLCYSTYCNAYPRALIELESYERIKDARTILENCRESEHLAELPLSAHLLAPVQRICRYPLHLNEIIKTALNSNTTEEVAGQTDNLDYDQLDVSQCDIPDTHATLNGALEKMRGITEAVNEGKRHSETIARHQSSFQNFKGPPLHLHSTRFFLQVDATRQKQNLWNSSCTLFLFDNQLIYCKRDLIKRSHFIYKGRIFLDRCRIVNVRDGKMFGHTIKNSLRIYCESRDKWYDFSFRSANRKHRFLNTLALERQFGGKALYVSEMTGFEFNYEERPGYYSDQSDYELPECEHAQGTASASGDSSVPESPAKSPYRSCDTLPKKSQSRDAIASTSNGSGQQLSTTSTGSLGRRRLGNWFRKPKSSNCTPSQSPTHKPGFDADITLTAARVAAIELVKAAAEQEEADSSFA